MADSANKQASNSIASPVSLATSSTRGSPNRPRNRTPCPFVSTLSIWKVCFLSSPSPPSPALKYGARTHLAPGGWTCWAVGRCDWDREGWCELRDTYMHRDMHRASEKDHRIGCVRFCPRSIRGVGRGLCGAVRCAMVCGCAHAYATGREFPGGGWRSDEERIGFLKLWAPVASGMFGRLWKGVEGWSLSRAKTDDVMSEASSGVWGEGGLIGSVRRVRELG